MSVEEKMCFSVLQLQFVLTSRLQLNTNAVFKEMQLYEVVVEFEKLVKSKDYCSWKGRSVLCIW